MRKLRENWRTAQNWNVRVQVPNSWNPSHKLRGGQSGADELIQDEHQPWVALERGDDLDTAQLFHHRSAGGSCLYSMILRKTLFAGTSPGVMWPLWLVIFKGEKEEEIQRKLQDSWGNWRACFKRRLQELDLFNLDKWKAGREQLFSINMSQHKYEGGRTVTVV